VGPIAALLPLSAIPLERQASCGLSGLASPRSDVIERNSVGDGDMVMPDFSKLPVASGRIWICWEATDLNHTHFEVG
jgi:hypothetical protein